MPEQAYIERFASPIAGALRRIEACYLPWRDLHQPAPSCFAFQTLAC
jgi:hypothetical protein